MAFPITPSRRTTQPALPRINRALASSLGMVALFDTVNGIELFSGARSSVNTSTRIMTSQGAAADFSGTANQRWTHQARFAITGDISMIAFVQVDAFSAYTPVISKQFGSTAYCPFEFRLDAGASSTTGRGATIVRASSSNYMQRWYDGVTVPTGIPTVVVIRAATNFYSVAPTLLYGSGGAMSAPLTMGSVSGGLATAAEEHSSHPDVWVGRRQDAATQLDGKIFYVALCNKQITQQQAKSVIDSPWSVYEDTPRLIPIDLSRPKGTMRPTVRI